MGSVWKALHLDLRVDVALKFIRPDTHAEKKSVERFRREARLLAQLKSAYIVQVLDFGLDQDAPYLAMEFLHGEDLGVLLDREQTLSPLRAYSIILEAARGLAVAHNAGVIHRDVKPSNLFASEQAGVQVIKVIDFGIAKERMVDSTETTQGLVLGSPAYMSPEQARGGTLDESTDVWSLAAVAYRILTGKPPIEGDNPNDTVVRICTESPRPVSELRSELGVSFDDVFTQCFLRDKKLRITSLEELTTRLGQSVIAFDPATSEQVHKLGPMLPTGARLSEPQLNIASRLGRSEETGSLLLPMHSVGGDEIGGDLRDNETASVSVAHNADPDELSNLRSPRSWLGRLVPLALLSLGATAYFGASASGVVPHERELESLETTQASLNVLTKSSTNGSHEPVTSLKSGPPDIKRTNEGSSLTKDSHAPLLPSHAPEPVNLARPTKKRSQTPISKLAPVPNGHDEQSSDEVPTPQRAIASDVVTDPVFGLPVHGP